MKLAKKLIPGIFCAFILIQLVAVGVSANDHTDRSHTFIWTTNNWCFTNPLHKTDKSSTYQKCVSVSVSGKTYITWAYGTDYLSGAPAYDVSHGTANHYTMTPGKKQWMINYAKEEGYYYVLHRADRVGSTAFKAQILWSPDSI